MKLPPGHVAGQGLVRPTGYGGFGERLMRSMGWQQGQGLGKTGDGIKEAIQVSKKEDTIGVSPVATARWPRCCLCCSLLVCPLRFSHASCLTA